MSSMNHLKIEDRKIEMTDDKNYYSAAVRTTAIINTYLRENSSLAHSENLIVATAEEKNNCSNLL